MFDINNVEDLVRLHEKSINYKSPFQKEKEEIANKILAAPNPDVLRAFLAEEIEKLDSKTNRTTSDGR